MKRIYLILGILFAMQTYAQQSTFMYFEDKNGLKDSLEIIVGLTDEQIDQLPYYTADEAVQALRDSTHWVLLGTGGRKYSQTYPYTPYYGMIEGKRRNMYISANRLPVTISWDKQFFIENGLTHSVMSDMGSWFDCSCSDGEIYKLLLVEADSCIVHNTYDGNLCSYDYFEGNYFEESMLVKWIRIALGAGTNPIEGIEAIPSDTPSASKQLRDGHIFILRGDKTYTLTSQPYGDK